MFVNHLSHFYSARMNYKFTIPCSFVSRYFFLIFYENKAKVGCQL